MMRMRSGHNDNRLDFILLGICAALALMLFACPSDAQTAPFGPTSITIATGTSGNSDHRGPNPVEAVDVEIVFIHTCSICVYEISLDEELTGIVDGETETSEYSFTFSDVPPGQHIIEIEARRGSIPCPPATERPTGCARYLAFTVLPDGTILIPPTNLRILPQ